MRVNGRSSSANQRPCARKTQLIVPLGLGLISIASSEGGFVSVTTQYRAQLSGVAMTFEEECS